MRILILQRFDLSSVSCARRVICQTEELLKRGHQVVLTDFIHRQRQETIPILTTLTSLGVELFAINRKIAALPANLLRLSRIKPKPDIIHLWKSYPDASIPAWLLSRYWNIPLHYDWDDWEQGIAAELAHSTLAGSIAYRWDRLMPHLCHSITVASAFLRKKTLEMGIEPQRIRDAHVGANLDQFYPRAPDQTLFQRLSLKRPLLVYSGQLEVASYAEQAVAVLKQVRNEIQTAQLLILGGGRKLESIKQHARQLYIEKHVHFTDYVPASDIPDYLALADVALAPFEKNNVTRAKSPLKIAEYLAMGLPVVASDIGDVRDMILGAGVPVPCNNIDEMARQVVWILNHKQVQEAMSAAGVRRAKDIYNWSHHTDNLLDAYRYAIRSFQSDHRS